MNHDYNTLLLKYSNELSVLQERERTLKAQISTLLEQLNLPLSITLKEIETLIQENEISLNKFQQELETLLSASDTPTTSSL